MALITYRKYNAPEVAASLVELLQQHNIAYEISEAKSSLDGLYGGDRPFDHEIFIKISKEDFPKADQLLEKDSTREIQNLNPDHYLYEFSDQELFDILAKPDEWNDLDYHFAKIILKERGKEINPEVIKLLKTQRLQELSKPAESQKTWVYAGYIMALLGGLIAIFIGWHLCTFKKSLPNGEKVYAHTPADRDHGVRIFSIGIVSVIIWFFYGGPWM